MSPERTTQLLLALYPPRWRARYGEELRALIVETCGDRVPWRVRANVALAAGRERLRDTGLAADAPAGERMRGGALVVLCAWALFVVGGVAVQKFSEHWQAATPGADRALPAAAFDALLAGAALGTVLVAAGALAAVPSFLRFLRAGGWPGVHRPLSVALGLTIAALPATVAIVVWGHQLTASQRNGRDLAYTAAGGVWVLLLVACLAAWTVAGVAIARRLRLSGALLRLEAALAGGVATAMAVMTAATGVWWAALARSAPGFLTDGPGAAAGSATPPMLLGAAALMLVATVAAAAGAGRALGAVAAAD